MSSKVIIVGAGVSGLILGYRLKQAGISFKILEARDRIGGRIHTIKSAEDTAVEMGATWFNDQHTQLKQLLKELDINYFEQYMEGTAFYQPVSTTPAKRVTLPPQAPSYRIVGGSSALIQTLANYIGSENILLNETLKQIDLSKPIVTLKTEKVFTASKVVLALPPKLWVNNIKFMPALETNLKDIAQHTHTWMEESIKVALTYKQPFWRLNKQSGALFSNIGPVMEFYDHCDFNELRYALCGFINPNLGKLAYKDRKELIINQIVSVYGNEAADLIDYSETLWDRENETYIKNESPLGPHQNNGHPSFRKSYYNNRLFISSSEAAAQYPGYMEGAVISAKDVFDHILAENH
mgnify:FL=1|jgi:monoamine oxidase|tara:strand:+ start:384 stop:1439 length:1056 start_codon:yes stop_codon:yes gene_type:complete